MAPSADPTKNTSTVEASNETTPLLGAPETVVQANGKANGHGTIPEPAQNEESETPMPYIQILLLCYASLAEPVAYFSIFPFVNEAIARNGGIAEENVGFWSGMIESLFSLVQMLLMVPYGRAADRLGRKPVLVWSLTGISFATALFGLSQTLWQMIIFRCLAGVFAGSVVTVRTMISENTNKHTQGRAFSWYMFTRNMGIFIGPLVGGGLANPAEQFPGTFGGVKFFENYPYALATFIAGFIVLTSAFTTFFFMKETLNRKQETSSASTPEPPMSTWSVLRAPGVLPVLWIYSHVALLALAYTAVSPVFLYTSIEKGGWSFSPKYISYFLALAGASQAAWMLLVFPYLQKTYSTGAVLRVCCVIEPFFMAQYPVFNELLRHGWEKTFWIGAPVSLVLGSGVAMMFACVQLCLNDVSPSPAVLGTLNSLGLTINSGIRAVMPAASTSVFAWGVKKGWADGHLVWFFLIVIAALLNVAAWYLPEAAEGRPDQQQPKKQKAAERTEEVTGLGEDEATVA